MSEVIKLFSDLSRFFHRGLFWEDIEKIYENVDPSNVANSNASDSEDSSDDEENLQIKTIESIPFVKRALSDSSILSVLQELSAAIRNIRASNSGYDNTFDCWDRVIEVCRKDEYIAFSYALLRLAKYKPMSKMHKKLSMAMASTYILSLTIPGAKGYHIFDEHIIEQALDIFELLRSSTDGSDEVSVTTQSRVEIWVNFSNLCDDLKLMFRYVHFDEYKDLRNTILLEIIKLLHHNHVHGYENIYAVNLHTKCFEIFDEVTNAHNGDPEETLMKIMRLTYCLHVYLPPRKNDVQISRSNTQFCEHVSDWFVRYITKCPRVASKVLKFYIECVVTNPEKEWRNEHLLTALDYAAKYDAAMYTNCNESIVEYLCDVGQKDSVQARNNSVQLLSRIVLIESKVNWEVFRHEISPIPREVHVIKEFIHRFKDVNNSVKLKALNGLIQAFHKGTEEAIKIITEGVKYSAYPAEDVQLPQEPRFRFEELRYKKPETLEPAYTFRGYELVQQYFANLPSKLYTLCHNTMANVRKAAISVLEVIACIHPLIIYKTAFVQQFSKLGEDPCLIVRKQALQSIDAILDRYPNCFPIIHTWCQVIFPLFMDGDPKLIEAAWQCFKRRVLDNINGIDKSNIPQHYMPWVILRVFLTSRKRQSMQMCINNAISKHRLDSKIINLIESHVLTANSTEAWTLLSFFMEKVKSKDPDTIISSFIHTLLEESWNVGHNMQIILEILTICVNDFSHTTLNIAFSNIMSLMKKGNIPLNIISKAFNLCISITCNSEKKKANNNKRSNAGQGNESRKKNLNQMQWTLELHNWIEQYLVANLNGTNRKTLMSLLFTYSEANLELPVKPKPQITEYVHKYLEKYLDTPDNQLESEDWKFVNEMIILATRFSIRDVNYCSITCVIYRLILVKTDRPMTVNNVIVSMADLCKKHTQIVEANLPELLKKLQSPYVEIRVVTFINVSQLVLQDLLKLRGILLISLMSSLLDKNVEVSNRAVEFFMSYSEKKNSHFFQKCLLECPFVFNGYLHFGGLDSISAIESKFYSPLKGETNAKSRRSLYRNFMHGEDEILLIMFFDHLKLIYNKVKTEETIKSPEGFSVIKDFLFILRHICLLGIAKKNKKDQEAEEAADDIEVAENQLAVSTNEPETSSSRTTRKSNAPTMNQAIAVVEKSINFLPKMAEILTKWDPSFQKLIDDLAIAIGKRFDTLIEFAQPNEFWEKYENDTTQPPPSKRRKMDTILEDSDDDNESDEESPSESERREHVPMSNLYQPLFSKA